MSLALPVRPRGRPTQDAEDRYYDALIAWCEAIKKIRSTLDFEVSARGWCYLGEPHGLAKGDFDRAEDLITHCRKIGQLPLSICAVDESRRFANAYEKIDSLSLEDYAAEIILNLPHQTSHYTPIGFWDDQPYYLQLLVEKIDLKSLFAPTCRDYRIPLGNAKGWSHLNSRAAMMQRFKDAEERGQISVLMYCGDHDPAGLLISDRLRSNMDELSLVVKWRPTNVIIDRFGLNSDFIDTNRLTWIDGLETGSGKDLGDPSHRDHYKEHVQNYIETYGRRKCEANALVVAPEAGRQLLLDTIHKYLPKDCVDQYAERLKEPRKALRVELLRQLREFEFDLDSWDEDEDE